MSEWKTAELLTDGQARQDYVKIIEKNDSTKVGEAFAVIAYSTLLDVIATNSGIDRTRLFDIFHRQAYMTLDERKRLDAVLLETVNHQE